MVFFGGLLELISLYDSFLRNHIAKHVNKGSGHVSYFSSTICNELIKLMGDSVMSVIIKELKDAKFFSISVDSTPDLSHIDQLTITVRYTLENGPMERFVKFIPMFNHTGAEIANIIFQFLDENGIDIKN